MIGGLEFKDVGVSRGDALLFEGLNLTVSSGEVLWVQGTNGVGKTTLLHMAAGLARPDLGEIIWERNDNAAPAEDVVGFQGHQDALKPSLTALEELTFWAALSDYEGSLDPIFNRIGLSERKHVRAGKLSAGQRRRLALGRLIVSRKPLWVMDEPSAVMDTAGTDLIDNLVQEHALRGGSAIIASHSAARKLSVTTRLLTLAAA